MIFLQDYIEDFNTMKGYFSSDRRLLSFFRHRLGNNHIEEIREKVIKVAERGQTNHFYVNILPERIKKMKIDTGLQKGDLSIVSQIMEINNNEDPGQFLIFVSKYCALHNPQSYPLWDVHSLNVIELMSKKKLDHSDYLYYAGFIKMMKEETEMNHLNFLDISKFFWVYQDSLIESLNALRVE
jgi:hypothetical protein